VFDLGLGGLALCTSLVALLNLGQLLLALRRPLGGVVSGSLTTVLVKMAAATALMAGAVLAGLRLLGGWLGTGFLPLLGGTLMLAAIGTAAYFTAATLLRLEETAVLRRMAARLRG
jgi:peptidoglycan biosynthesis protein MviN/MurJ (putative lipid II flippase)